MNKLYHITTITLVCTFLSTTTREIKTKKPSPSIQVKTITAVSPAQNAPSQLATPIALSPKTYKQLHDDIAAMKSDLVVAQDGIFTDYFINFIKDNVEKSQLSTVFAQTLLEAGMSLHASLSENNTVTARILKRNSQHIEDMMNSLKPAPIAQHQKEQKTISTVQPNPQPTVSQPQKTLSIPDKKPLPQPPHIEYTKKLSGPVGLKEFRKQSSNEPLEAFYAHEKVNPEWLTKALHILLDDQPLTSMNKDQMKGELVGNATELMRELLHKNHIASNLWNTFIHNVTHQAIDFINNQLPHQKQTSSPIPPAKIPHTEPITDGPKTPATQPEQKTAQKSDKNPHLPTWMTPQNTLIIKELEIEMLQYIFENQEASQETIAQHFIQQVPKNIKTREILINGIKATVGKILQEPLGPEIPLEAGQTPLQKTSSADKFPYWIDSQGLNIRPSDLDKEIARFIANNTDADNDDIANHFISLIPLNIPHKRLIERQIRDTITDFFAR